MNFQFENKYAYLLLSILCFSSGAYTMEETEESVKSRHKKKTQKQQIALSKNDTEVIIADSLDDLLDTIKRKFTKQKITVYEEKFKKIAKNLPRWCKKLLSEGNFTDLIKKIEFGKKRFFNKKLNGENILACCLYALLKNKTSAFKNICNMIQSPAMQIHFYKNYENKKEYFEFCNPYLLEIFEVLIVRRQFKLLFNLLHILKREHYPTRFVLDLNEKAMIIFYKLLEKIGSIIITNDSTIMLYEIYNILPIELFLLSLDYQKWPQQSNCKELLPMILTSQSNNAPLKKKKKKKKKKTDNQSLTNKMKNLAI